MPLGPLVFRTLVDTLIFTPRIARDVILGTRGYFSPLRLFISLMGLQFGIAAFFGLPAFYSLETLLAPEGRDLAEAHLTDMDLSHNGSGCRIKTIRQPNAARQSAGHIIPTGESGTSFQNKVVQSIPATRPPRASPLRA